MNLYRMTRANDPVLHFLNVRMIAVEPWIMTKEGFFASFPSTFEPTDNFRVIDRTFATSHGCAVWNADEMLIVMGGTVGNQNLQAMIDGWVRGYTYAADNTMPRTFGQAWDDVVRQVPEIMSGTYRRIRLIGYSFGGGVVTAGVALLAGLHRRIEKEVFTYGAPRTSYANGFSNWTHVPIVRVWHSVDPVVNMPPHTPELPLLTGVIGQSFAGNMNRVWHPVGGLRLNADGTFDSAEESTTMASYQYALLGAWLIGSEVFGSPNHALTNYTQALTAAVARIPAQPAIVVPRHGDRVPMPAATELRALVGRALETSGRNSQEDVRRAVADVLSRVELIPRTKFRPRTIFQNRVITYSGETVLSTPQRRFRRQVLRALNKLVPLS